MGEIEHYHGHKIVEAGCTEASDPSSIVRYSVASCRA